MSINLMKIFIRCPYCGYETIEYDYHENTSSDRYEYFNVLNKTLYPFTCSKCRAESSYDDLFMGAYCRAEDVDAYKKVLIRGLKDYLRTGCFYFSEWNPDLSEQPALNRLCMMYPKDIELQKIAQDYKRARIYGSIFLDELEARDSQEIYKKTKNCNKEEIYMPFRITGLSTPFGGVSWEYTTSPKKRIMDFFRFLESKRLLTNPWYLEVVSQCVESALEIKSALVSLTNDVDFLKEDCFVISTMIDASNKFLDELNKIQDFIPYVHTGNNLFDYALKKYRDEIKNGVRYFEASYDLKFGKDI